MHEVRKPRAGAVRYSDKYAGEQVVVEPGNHMYSTALMVAEDYWCEKTETWVAINPPEQPNA